MDSLTHIALGACIGEAFFEKGFGKKAMIWGALAQSIPDIDFIAATWLGSADNLLVHRGFTHSILFAVLMIPLFALLAGRVHRPHNISFRKWIAFFAIEIFLHLFLDSFNSYGIGWLEPFSHIRFSFNAIFVADPFFSIWPGISLAALIILHKHHRFRVFWWRFGLILPFLYLGYCTINKLKIDSDTREILAKQHIPHERYLTTPTPLNNWLWFVVSGNDSGYYIGYRSVFDKEKQISFHFFPRNDSLMANVHEKEDLQKLIRFSQGLYVVEKWNDTLVFNDLRFGQISGWNHPRQKFVFHYYLDHPGANKLVMQRGRFEGWNREEIKSLLYRIRGR
jgi:inner membrane protein